MGNILIVILQIIISITFASSSNSLTVLMRLYSLPNAPGFTSGSADSCKIIIFFYIIYLHHFNHLTRTRMFTYHYILLGYKYDLSYRFFQSFLQDIQHETFVELVYARNQFLPA